MSFAGNSVANLSTVTTLVSSTSSTPTSLSSSLQNTGQLKASDYLSIAHAVLLLKASDKFTGLYLLVPKVSPMNDDPGSMIEGILLSRISCST